MIQPQIMQGSRRNSIVRQCFHMYAFCQSAPVDRHQLAHLGQFDADSKHRDSDDDSSNLEGDLVRDFRVSTGPPERIKHAGDVWAHDDTDDRSDRGFTDVQLLLDDCDISCGTGKRIRWRSHPRRTCRI